MYLHERNIWPHFTWSENKISPLLAATRQQQGLLLGRLQQIGFSLQDEAELEMRTLDVLKSSEIEGEMLNAAEVRSSVARQLGIEEAGLVNSSRFVDGVVSMTLDATHNYKDDLTDSRLFGWQAALFPIGYNGMHKVLVGQWRTSDMQVVSGPLGKEHIHYVAPVPQRVPQEMKAFLRWFNTEAALDPVMKAALAHFYFVSIHPFDDGNGRIARAIADLQLARSDGSPRRFYSMSNQIWIEKKDYYAVLERAQKGEGDLTAWMEWFLECLARALQSSEQVLEGVFRRAEFWRAHESVTFNERQRKMLQRLTGEFEGKLNSSKWQKMTGASQDTALRDIQDLIRKGILKREESGGRSTSYRLIW